MLARIPRTVVSLAFAFSVSSLAFAQAPAAPAATAAQPQQESQPAPTTTPSPAGSAAPSNDAATPKAPVREATGYAPSSIKSAGSGSRGKSSGAAKGTRTKRPAVDRKAQTGAFVVEPGFRLLDGGGTRFFVELGQSVGIEERKAKGALSFVLKGARNAFRNNYNPLVTEHFNTPVRRAKLSPAGHDLVFTLEMRQDVPAKNFGVVTDQGGHAFFQVDFDPGAFVKEAPQPLPEPGAAEGEEQNGGGADNAGNASSATEPAQPARRAAPPRTKGAGPKP